jgi:hypothetical protein
MTRLIPAIFLFVLPLAAGAADEGRFSYLEQEIRNLQRQVTALSRRVDQLDSRPPRPTTPRGIPSSPPAETPDTWLDAQKWRQIKPGMSELEVVSLLGPPASVREVDGSRVMFYALEIGASGFLGGSVRFRDRAVSEVQQPVLQ